MERERKRACSATYLSFSVFLYLRFVKKDYLQGIRMMMKVMPFFEIIRLTNNKIKFVSFFVILLATFLSKIYKISHLFAYVKDIFMSLWDIHVYPAGEKYIYFLEARRRCHFFDVTIRSLLDSQLRNNIYIDFVYAFGTCVCTNKIDIDIKYLFKADELKCDLYNLIS